MLCKGRSWIVPMFSVGPAVRLACALPAMLLTVSVAYVVWYASIHPCAEMAASKA